MVRRVDTVQSLTRLSVLARASLCLEWHLLGLPLNPYIHARNRLHRRDPALRPGGVLLRRRTAASVSLVDDVR
jgi:hypothetical protein